MITQTIYNGITPKLGYQITEVLKLCSSTNAKKISELTKEACTALGLPLDTKGGGKPPAQNVAIFEWLRDNKTTVPAETTDLSIVETVTPEINNDDATTAESIVDIATDLDEVLPVPEITTNADLFALETENVIVPIGINENAALPKLTATEARQKVNNSPYALRGFCSLRSSRKALCTALM